VLGDTEPLHYAAWRDTLAPAGIAVAWEFYAVNCVGVADDALFPKVFAVGAEQASRMVARKRELFRASLEANPPVPDATARIVRSLATRPMAVVSSSARIEVEPPLIRAGIRDCFRLVITREDVTRIKPDPEPYLKAARLLGSTCPLVVEDSASGIASAEAAGFEVVRISSPGAMPGELRARLQISA